MYTALFIVSVVMFGYLMYVLVKPVKVLKNIFLI